MSFKLNKNNKTASLFKITKNSDTIIIPRSINYESEEYLITSIIKFDKKIIKSLQFSPQSQVHTIYPDSLKDTQIESLFLPDSLINLKEGWSLRIEKLTKIIISPSNGQFIYKDDKFLLGKTDPQIDDFDVLLFARRNLTEADIPSNIKIIESDAFLSCRNLYSVNFSKDSQLQIIGRYAFSGTKISRIHIPSSVTRICEGAFSLCKGISIFETEEDSKLEVIEKYAFKHSEIQQIYFPGSLKHLDESCLSHIKNPVSIKISPKNDQFVYIDNGYLLGKTDPKSDNFDAILFVSNIYDEFTVPSYIKVIGPYSFSGCRRLERVNFPDDSKLEIIEKFAFAHSRISQISIPKTVTKICSSAFVCASLSKIEIPEDSNLIEIGSSAFSNSQITEICIPQKVATIGDVLFDFCSDLQKVEIPQNSNLKSIGMKAFHETDIEEIYIPQGLVDLKDEWFLNAKKLTKITVSPLNGQFIFKDDKILLGKTDPQSNDFDVLLFARRNVTEVDIPSNIKIIKSDAFTDCIQLQTVNFSKDSQLEIISEYAFSGCYSLTEIYIPSTVTKICQNSFRNCRSLQKVEIPKDSNLQSIESLAFNKCNINEIYIPPTVTVIDDKAFMECYQLKKIEIQENSKLIAIGESAFRKNSIEEFYIPQNLIELEEACFSEAI